jgi:hypothetical protein
MKLKKLSDHPELKALFKAAFPEYRGRKWAIEEQTYSKGIRSYWTGGSRSWYVIIRLADAAQVDVEDGHPYFDHNPLPDGGEYEARPGFVLIEHCHFCGHDLGLRAYFHAEDMTKMLPEEVTP